MHHMSLICQYAHLIQTISYCLFLICIQPICCIGLDLDRFDAIDRSYYFLYSYDVLLYMFVQKCVLNIGVRRRNGGVFQHVGAYRCVTDAYECIKMHAD